MLSLSSALPRTSGITYGNSIATDPEAFRLSRNLLKQFLGGGDWSYAEVSCSESVFFSPLLPRE